MLIACAVIGVGGGNAGLGWRFLLACMGVCMGVCMGALVYGGVGVWGCVWGRLYCKVKGGWGYRVWGRIYVFITSPASRAVQMPPPPSFPLLSQSPPPPKFLQPRPRSLNTHSQNFYKSFGYIYVHCTPRFCVHCMTQHQKTNR